MKIKYKIAVILLLTFSMVQAQNRMLTGNVKDDNGEPLPGCNVSIENELNRSLSGTMADFDGNFRLNLPSGDNFFIVFSFIGYVSQKIPFTGQTVQNVVLKEDNITLEDVTIVAERGNRNSLGLTQRELVTATQTFNMDVLENAPTASIEDALQGRMAGVDIVSGGDPGARSSIRIRGTASLNANAEPLIVVDGVPYPTTISNDFNFNTANDEDFGALVNISPADIQSIEVLKDAAATAVWGSRGANGVLIFTTKKGSKGKTRFSFNTRFDVKREPNTIPMLNSDQYITLIQDALSNSLKDAGYDLGRTYSNLRYNTPEINFDPTWVYFDEYNQETDWLDEVTQVGFTTDNSFSISGGGDKATYRVSLGYLNELGTTKGTGFERFSSLISVNYRFSDRFRVTSDFSFAESGRDSYWTGDDVSSPRGEALTKMPNMSPYVIDDNNNRTSEYFTPIISFDQTWEDDKMYNPVAMVNESKNRTVGRNARAIFTAIYDLTSDLEYKGVLGLDMRTTKNKRLLPNVATGVRLVDSQSNLSSDNLSDNMYFYTENRLLYRKVFAQKHSLVLTGIFQTNEARNASYSSSSSGTPSASLADPTGGAAVADLGSGNSLSRSLGFISNAHYTYNQKYTVSAGYRYEGNSAMGKDTRWGGFATLGAAWHFGEENWGQQLIWLNEGKLRLSWGESGNPPGGSYPYIGAFSALNENYISMTSIQPSSMQLDNLRWETITQTNLGIDLDLFRRKLHITADVYDMLTTDMLHKNVSIPESTGYGTVSWYNSGSMSNKGLELIVGYDVIRNKTWALRFDVNMARNVNEVIELPDILDFENYDFKNGAYAHKIVEGNPLGSFYGYRNLGVYQNEDETIARDLDGNPIRDILDEPVIISNGNQTVYPGDAKYEDVNGDGVINQYDIVYIGNAMPLFTGGAGFLLRYKNISLNTFFHTRVGHKIVNQTRINLENMYGPSNQSTAVRGRWRKEGDNTDIPRALYERGYNYLGSDRFVEDGSFVRLKTISLKYSFSKERLRKVGIDRLDLWLTGYDLWTWTNYTGQDPEVPLSRDIYQLSVDKSSTPKAKRFAIGMTLNF